MDHLKIRGTIGFDVLNLIGLVGLRLRSQKPLFNTAPKSVRYIQKPLPAPSSIHTHRLFIRLEAALSNIHTIRGVFVLFHYSQQIFLIMSPSDLLACRGWVGIFR